MARTDPRPHYGTKRRTRDDGYIDIYEPDHPIARRDGYIMEHRKVAWDAGLLTDPNDQVHHVNEVKTDNYLGNFEIKSGSQHALDHAEERGYVINQFGTFPIRPREQRQPAPRPIGRLCVGCGAPISPEIRRDATYCSGNCRVRTWKRNNR